MKRLINIVFPLIDELYIYQLLEYQSKDFFKWFVHHPFKRNLQRKQKISWTAKAKLLFLISLGLIVVPLLFNSHSIVTNLILSLIRLQLSPIFIIVANFLFSFAENIQKARIIEAAIDKRTGLKNIKTIAIVGSYAKTSTKNMLYTLLWKDFRIVKTPKSYNTELSIARSILLDLKSNTEIFICEMDAYKPGEINRLCTIAKPNLGIITTIGPQHLERFGSMESLAKTQFELANFLKESGTLFINSQDTWSDKLSQGLSQKIVFFNNTENSISDRKESDNNQSFNLHLGKERVQIVLPLKGEHNAFNFLAAATIALNFGVSVKAIQSRAKLILPTEHRLEIRVQGNMTVLDNTYNANPQTARSSLDLLNSFKDYHKVIITPGFVELGKEHELQHIKFGKQMGSIANDIIIVGENAKNPLKRGTEESGFSKDHLYFMKTVKEALDKLPDLVQGKKVAVLLENDLPDQYF